MGETPSDPRMGREERRSRQGLWLAIGLIAILAGYPLGLLLVSLGAPDAWGPLYVILAAIAILAGVLFVRAVRHRQRPQPPLPPP